jgi:beta-barrel assembly-enhancing protease
MLKLRTIRLAVVIVGALIGCSILVHAQQPGDSVPTAKAGGKDDISAIGNREIAGRGVGNWYSIEKEIQVGREYASTIDNSAKLLKDPVITEYVNRLGQNIVRNSDSKVPFTIKVIDSSEVNAFALPGGYLYVNSGLILLADAEAELAGVMAHEVAHVAARHAMRQMTRSNWANLGSLPLIFLSGGIGYAAWQVANIGIPMTFLKFSRGFEEEADHFGVQYLYKTGYDPQAFLSFFEKMQAKEKVKPGTLSKLFASHPAVDSRIANAQEQVAQKLPAREQYVLNTSEFEDIRARIARMENRRQLDERQDARPTLRRAPQTNDRSEQEAERPTLKRRPTQSGGSRLSPDGAPLMGEGFDNAYRHSLD